MRPMAQPGECSISVSTGSLARLWTHGSKEQLTSTRTFRTPLPRLAIPMPHSAFQLETSAKKLRPAQDSNPRNPPQRGGPKSHRMQRQTAGRMPQLCQLRIGGTARRFVSRVREFVVPSGDTPNRSMLLVARRTAVTHTSCARHQMISARGPMPLPWRSIPPPAFGMPCYVPSRCTS